jgi:hypothetical protein
MRAKSCPPLARRTAVDEKKGRERDLPAHGRRRSVLSQNRPEKKWVMTNLENMRALLSAPAATDSSPSFFDEAILLVIWSNDNLSGSGLKINAKPNELDSVQLDRQKSDSGRCRAKTQVIFAEKPKKTRFRSDKLDRFGGNSNSIFPINKRNFIQSTSILGLNLLFSIPFNLKAVSVPPRKRRRTDKTLEILRILV